ncbi:elongator complex subunit 5 [Parastagonospora nodorum]|nr:elongator complex subunit 5 [Parastagonospora nodorum]KAH4710548.1 elongator complex subunit 5 [Parastagonospora nodorum]KAH4715175.1 elongator complex subunit 5 [Parastagonospora nodorum]KAH4784754.1 elongator complex subunit 5 [Parastagonospora nodorum]KAH4838482.1 elongator complex subunit 5 [Parastagonospora nodorum]
MFNAKDCSEAEWAQIFSTPNFWEKVHNEFGRIPDWLISTHQRIERKALVRSQRRFRPADSKVWIVEDNYDTHGIRTQRRKPAADWQPAKKMAISTPEQHHRHSIHLMMRVLCLRNNVSPFTLVLDDLNQRAMPFVHEMMRRALSRNIHVIVVSFEATEYDPAIQNIPAYAASSVKQIMQDLRNALELAKESLVVVDSLSDLLEVEGIDIGELFNLVANKYASTLVGVYHQDMLPTQDAQNAYAPQPLELLKYMATSVIVCKSFAHVLAAKAARERSLPEPTFGLLQGAEGIVQCLDANDYQGIVLEAEFRRKSGRPEGETYFLREARATDYSAPTAGMVVGKLKEEFVTLLELVPAYASKEVVGFVNAAADDMESTFNLGLTEKQKQAREGVVLPYFDAQKGEGGEGGRILYDMGEEDDFDEEEDEI